MKAAILQALVVALVAACIKTAVAWTFIGGANVPVGDWSVPEEKLGDVEYEQVSLLEYAVLSVRREREAGLGFPHYLWGPWFLVKTQAPYFVLDVCVIFLAMLYVLMRSRRQAAARVGAK